MENQISVVTGANGHLGNNLTRLLLAKGKKVRASVRNLQNLSPFNDLDCEIVKGDITDKNTLLKAFQGSQNVFAVGASFKLWAKNPQKEIYEVNMQGTQNLFEAAAESGVKNIVYVSSIASLNYTQVPTNEANGYNPDRRNWYYNSKNDSDKLALELADKYHIRTMIVLPSAMIGSLAFELSYSQRLVLQILQGQIPVETTFTLNWVDVKDVAEGCYQALLRGRAGERYILANEKSMSLRDSVQVAADLYPSLKLKLPQPVPKWLLYSVAGLMEMQSKITGKEPQLQRHYVDMFYGLKTDFDISKARNELGFNPKPAKQALSEALKYLKEDWLKK